MSGTVSPLARVDAVEKTIGSVTFTDPYAWLQDDSPEALAWQWEQDALAQRQARSWPHFERLGAAIAASGSGYVADLFTRSAPRRLGGRWFWAGPAPRAQNNALWMAASLDEPGTPLIESGQLCNQASAGDPSLIYWYEPSPDGKYIAACVTSGGSTTGVWRVIDVDRRHALEIELPATAYNGALPGWLPDGSGFYLHDRVPDGRHRFRFIPVRPGTSSRPEVTFDFVDVPMNVSGLTPEVSPGGRWIIGLAGPHERIAYVLGDTHTGVWRSFLPGSYQGECSGAWCGGETYIARVHGGLTPRGRVVAIPATTSRDESTWRELVPQSESVLRAVTVIQDRIVIADVHDVSTRFRVFDLNGQDERILPVQGPGSSVVAFLTRRFDRSEELTFGYETFTRPMTLYHCDVRNAALRTLGVSSPEQHGLAVSQHFAVSLDGVRVPYFLIHARDLDLSSPRPTLLTGYGGFNVALLPMYLAHLVPFVRAGGVVAHANLRGGAEYGRTWHEAGRLACKWNTFLDLFAVAEDLVARKVTTSDRLAMTGSSNGGLLAAAAIVHRPDLFRVVVPVVPLLDQMEPLPPDPALDPLRSILIEDYGDPRHPVMSKVLFSYSPYHNIKPGVAYPAVFQVFGEHDLGCRPCHGRKFTARLQAASTSGRAVLLRVWKKTGHGALGDSAAVTAQATEWLSFIMRELGMSLPDLAGA